MYFYILFIIVVSTQGFKLYLEKEQNISIVQDNKVNDRFTQESFNQTQCHPSKLFMINYNEKYSKFIFENDQQKPFNVIIHPLVFDNDILDIKYTHIAKILTIDSNKYEQYIINYECKQIQDQQTWSLVLLDFKIVFDQNNSESYSIQFYKQCKQPEQFLHPLIVLLILAITLIIIGSNYGLQEIKALEQIKTEEFNSKTSILFILSASLLLFSLYKFPQIGQIVLSIIFFFMSMISFQIILEEQLQKYTQYKVLSKILSYLIGLCLVSFYFYTKHWILNNILAFIITLLMFKIIEIDSMKTACLLLSLAFFYDIFWVFISPYFFGTSVMAQVATTIDLPLKFICPSLMQSYNTPLMKCSLLGLGDILLPGIVIKYVLKFETMINKGYCLYITSIIGYSIGLLICMLSLVIYQHAQPALLYLVPIILIPVLLISLIKQQFYSLWKGQIFKQQKQGGVYELQQSEQV